MTYNYETIIEAITRAIEVADADLDVLLEVGADEDIIFQVEKDIALMDEAIEIIARFEALEL